MLIHVRVVCLFFLASFCRLQCRWLSVRARFYFDGTIGRYLVSTIGRQGRDHCDSLQHGRPDRVRTETKGESRFGGQQYERTSVSSDTHSAKRERLSPRGRKSAEFLFPVQADSSAERHSPFWARARQCRNLSLAHPPSLFQAVPSGTASASAFNDGPQASGIPAALVWQSSLSCARVPPWPWCTTIHHLPMALLGRGSGYWEMHIYIFPIVSSRVFFSARSLSDVAASQVPSLAAAAEILYSLSCHCHF